ncbi:MAG: DUF2283 domain-containing protein [Dehalococcoidia bacterium]
MIKLNYSEDVDALLIGLSDKPVGHAQESGQLIVHFPQDGEPVILETLGAREFVLGSLSSVVMGKESTLP